MNLLATTNRNSCGRIRARSLLLHQFAIAKKEKTINRFAGATRWTSRNARCMRSTVWPLDHVPATSIGYSAMGVDKWIDQQLHPDKIDDHALDARLSPFRTLRMDTRQIVENFPASAGDQGDRGRQTVYCPPTPPSAPSTKHNWSAIRRRKNRSRRPRTLTLRRLQENRLR